MKICRNSRIHVSNKRSNIFHYLIFIKLFYYQWYARWSLFYQFQLHIIHTNGTISLMLKFLLVNEWKNMISVEIPCSPSTRPRFAQTAVPVKRWFIMSVVFRGDAAGLACVRIVYPFSTAAKFGQISRDIESTISVCCFLSAYTNLAYTNPTTPPPIN